MAKKKRPKKAAPAPASGIERADRKRERLEARRRAKAEAMAAARRREARERIVRGLVYAGIAVALVWFFFFRTQTPDAIAGHEIQKFAETGVNQHVSGQVNYETTPPVAGPHAATPAPCGTHAQPIPNENLVHSLEHGAVAVLYRPDDVDLETIRAIEELVSSFDSRTISAPFPEMPSPIAVVSWGEKMELESFDRSAVREYIEVFRGRGPEGVDCPNSAAQTFTPAETPSPEAGQEQTEEGDGSGNSGGSAEDSDQGGG